MCFLFYSYIANVYLNEWYRACVYFNSLTGWNLHLWCYFLLTSILLWQNCFFFFPFSCFLFCLYIYQLMPPTNLWTHRLVSTKSVWSLKTPQFLPNYRKLAGMKKTQAQISSLAAGKVGRIQLLHLLSSSWLPVGACALARRMAEA